MSQGVTVQGRSEQELMEPPAELELSGSGAPGQGVWVINGLGLVRVAAQPPCQERGTGQCHAGVLGEGRRGGAGNRSRICREALKLPQFWF